MPHLDPERLAQLALDTQAPSPEEQAHLDSCATCSAELARLARAVAAARLGTGEPLERPGPAVWAGIADDLALAPDLRADPLRPAAPLLPRAARARRRRTTAVLALAAAVVLIAGVGGGLLLFRPAPSVATAMLRAFPGWTGQSGTAVLERAADGQEVVRLTTTVRPDASTDHEVWLMTAGAKRLVSLGYLHGTGGVFAVPSGVDLARFRLVDVSDEPRDGNPAHSGDSIIRGTFRA